MLFLDELSEFVRSSLEALRQPLEDGRVTIVRGQRVMAFPTRFMLVAASNPCPCGMGEDALPLHAPPTSRATTAACPARCSTASTCSSPSAVPPPRRCAASRRPPSAGVRERVVGGARAPGRTASPPTALACNAQMTPRLLREQAAATPSALRLLYELHDRHRLSARGHGRVLRVARTVADLEGSDEVGPEHINVAAGLRLDSAALAGARR